MKPLRTKCFVITLLLLAVYFFSFHMFINLRLASLVRPKRYLREASSINIVVHLDLKGAPPKLSYLQSLLPLLQDSGANGLLIEYEDMFPYTGKIANISAKNSYDKTELRNFISKAVERGFEIIPLIQTFGHMEHVLKLSEFQHLRESQKYPESICPSKGDSVILIKDMLKQVIEFHDSIKPLNYIHIGCDEVFRINQCTKCRERNVSDIDIFLTHIKNTSFMVRSMTSKTKVLIWDDMLRTNKPLRWQNMDDLFIQPVLWDYTPSVDTARAILINSRTKMQNIWASSAFKGADGQTNLIPIFRYRYLNNFNWMKVINEFKSGRRIYNFQGVILTGWSRYSHMDPLCELLPISIPTMIANTMLVSTFDSAIKYYEDLKSDPDEYFSRILEDRFNELFSCNGFHGLSNVHVFSCCSFEGRELYLILQRYIEVNTEIKSYLNSEEQGISTIQYYTSMNSTNLGRVEDIASRCKWYIEEFGYIERNISIEMAKYYEEEVINEYVDSKIHDTKLRLVNILKTLDDYLNRQTWERRPLSYRQKLQHSKDGSKLERAKNVASTVSHHP